MIHKNAPIFIVGCPHSGTTLLLNIMGSHSRIHAIVQETSFAFFWNAPCDQVSQFFADCDAAAVHEGKQRWIEKTPGHILRLQTLLDFFPDGKILILIRDGRDVAYSLHDRFKDWVGVDQWVNENREGQKFWNHPNVFCIRYENVIENRKATLTEVMTFVGEEFEDSMLLYHQKPKYYCAERIEKPSDASGDNHSLHRNWQINQPLFDGRGRWLAMTEAERQLVKQKAGALLIELGYTSDMNW